jgi:tripartite-type tricarboxylate transporter receptor subunit TctC
MKDKKFTQKEKIKTIEETIGMLWSIQKLQSKKIEELVNSIKEDKAKECKCNSDSYNDDPFV